MAKKYRVALVAMSGVRVKDQELLSLGMTLPGFVDRSRVIASLPSLSLLTLAAHSPPHWEPVYFEVDELNESTETQFEKGNFDLVAISSFSARILDAYKLSDRLRSKGGKVVLGGLHVSALPNEAALHADAIVQGEAEVIWPQLLKDFEQGRLSQRYSSFNNQKLIPSFQHMPTPRYDLLDIEKYNRLTLQTSRGCPLHCHFCAASRTISAYRLKSIEQVDRELEAIFKIWDRPFIELADDNTFVNKKWSRDLVKLFKRRPMKWFTETDISVADDPELLELLSESNCAQVLIGFESAVPESLTGIDRGDWKRAQYDGYFEKIDRIQSYGISVNGCFMLGLDSDDENVFELTESFVKDSALSEVQITLLTPFPGTDLYRSFLKEGRLLKEIFWDQCTLFDVTFEPARMSVETLRDGFRSLMRSLYSDERVADRKKSFKKCRRNRRSIMQNQTGEK